MTEPTEQRIDDLVALAVLGELSVDEELELDALLAADDELRDEVDGSMAVAAELQSLLDESPPAGLRASVLDAIASTPQIPAVPVASSETVASSEPVVAPVVDLAARRQRRWIPALAAAAAFALLAGVGAIFVAGDSGGSGDQVAAVVAADDAVARELVGDMDGSLTVVYSAGEDAIVIDGDGMRVLDEDRAYVLWLVDDSGAIPVQTFRPDGSGAVSVRVDDVDPTDFVLGITEEDAAGAETPTLPILASA